MKRFIKKSFLLALLTFAAASFSFAQKIADRVLFISSYSYAWETVPEQIRGIKSALKPGVTLDFQFMDVKNVDTPESNAIFKEHITNFLASVKPYDVIIAGDDAAFNFVLDNREELFKDIPFIFEGVNNVQGAKDAAKLEKCSGIIESLSYRGTLELAMKLYPKADKIVAILDDTLTGQGERNVYYSFRETFPGYHFSEINASRLTEEELKIQVSHLDESNILLYIMCTNDSTGKMFAQAEAIDFITKYAQIPVFSIVSIGMGKGFVGGEIVSQEMMGFQAGQMAQKILNGDNPNLLPLQSDTPKNFVFDENVMNRFDIKLSALPANSSIINHKMTWGENHEKLIRNLFIIIAVLCLSALIPLFIQNRNKEKKNSSIQKLNEVLDRNNKYDHLTNLLNRRVFDSDLNKKIEEGKPFAILIYDLDNFKTINDTYGHNQGDAVLCELARRAHSLSDSFFSIYRLAGDEFTAIISDNDRPHVESYVREIQNRMNEPYDIGEAFLNLHASIGIALWPDDAIGKNELVAAADKALYYVKNNGKGGFSWADDLPSQ